MAQFLCIKFSLIPSNFPLIRESDTKKAEQFCKSSILEGQNWPKHQFSQIVKCQMAIFCFTVNFVIKELKFCKIVQLFLCQFLWWVRGNLREQEKNQNTKTGPMSVPEQRQWSGCLWFAIQQLPGLLSSSIVIPLQRHCPPFKKRYFWINKKMSKYMYLLISGFSWDLWYSPSAKSSQKLRAIHNR
jgi:hypothetical protein